MSIKLISLRIVSIVFMSLLASCDEEWLDAKRDLRLIVPETLNDMKLLIRDENNLAKDNNNLIELSADDYYIPSASFASRTVIERNAYLWEKDVYEGQQNLADWNQAYSQVEVANVIIEGLSRIERNSSNQHEWDDVKGSALHLRGRAMYYLAQTFSPPYDSKTASTDLGIPIRLKPDTQAPTVRSTLQETYDQILADFNEAASLLPNAPEFIMDASKPSAYGYLARCYLVMSNFQKALEFSQKYLDQHSELLDFNTLNLNATFPIPRYNREVAQHSESSRVYGAFVFSSSRIDNSIYSQYANNDLRKVVFFRNMGSGESGTYGFRGSYTGGVQLFSGISTNEMYLIRSESNARMGNVQAAIKDINDLLITRWTAGTYIPYTASSAEEALNLILIERRKELMRRGQRWIDLRRLNKESRYATKIVRVLDGVQYDLPPNDQRYVLPIPDYVITLSGIQQNPR